MSPWAGVGAALAVVTVALYVVGVVAANRAHREVLPPIPRRALNALPPDDPDGTR